MTAVRCPHGRDLCSECIIIDDAAKRAYDIVVGLATFTPYEVRTRSYLAIRLSDGGSDQVLYDSKQAAVRHQIHETQCAYFSFRHAPHGFSSVRDAAIFLAWNRATYDAGHRLPDPDDRLGGPDLIVPTSNEHLFNQLGRLIGGHHG